MTYRERLQDLGSFSIKRRLRGMLLLSSHRIGGHGEDRDRLFSELHSRRTRGNGTELHPNRVVEHQNKGLERWATFLLIDTRTLSWPCFEHVSGPGDLTMPSPT